jgi:DNA primase
VAGRTSPTSSCTRSLVAGRRTSDRPTALAFDLDPASPATIVECCRVGLLLEGMFRGLGLQSFPEDVGLEGPAGSTCRFTPT